MSDTYMPSELADVIALHREMFGGYQMEDDDGGEAAQPDQSGDGQQPDGDPAPADTTDWKSEARKWEDRAKANKAAADELAQLREAQKTDEQKRAEELDALRAKVAAFETEKQVAAWAEQVSKNTGIPASALRGSSLEELQAHAEQLKALIAPPAADSAPEPGRIPTPGKTPGKQVSDKDAIGRALFGV